MEVVHPRVHDVLRGQPTPAPNPPVYNTSIRDSAKTSKNKVWGARYRFIRAVYTHRDVGPAVQIVDMRPAGGAAHPERARDIAICAPKKKRAK